MSGADGIRTHYLFSAIEALSQLSYGPGNANSIFNLLPRVKSYLRPSDWGELACEHMTLPNRTSAN